VAVGQADGARADAVRQHRVAQAVAVDVGQRHDRERHDLGQVGHGRQLGARRAREDGDHELAGCQRVGHAVAVEVASGCNLVAHVPERSGQREGAELRLRARRGGERGEGEQGREEEASGPHGVLHFPRRRGGTGPPPLL